MAVALVAHRARLVVHPLAGHQVVALPLAVVRQAAVDLAVGEAVPAAEAAEAMDTNGSRRKTNSNKQQR